MLCYFKREEHSHNQIKAKPKSNGVKAQCQTLGTHDLLNPKGPVSPALPTSSTYDLSPRSRPVSPHSWGTHIVLASPKCWGLHYHFYQCPLPASLSDSDPVTYCQASTPAHTSFNPEALTTIEAVPSQVDPPSTKPQFLYWPLYVFKTLYTISILKTLINYCLELQELSVTLAPSGLQVLCVDSEETPGNFYLNDATVFLIIDDFPVPADQYWLSQKSTGFTLVVLNLKYYINGSDTVFASFWNIISHCP